MGVAMTRILPPGYFSTAHYFAMNGENGKVCGVLPVDSKKLVRLFLTIFIPVFVLLLLGGYLI